LRLLADRGRGAAPDLESKATPLLTSPASESGNNAAPQELSTASPLEWLWAAHLVGAFDNEFAEKQLYHRDPQVRLWTIRLLGDERRVSPAIAKQLAELAAAETNLEVRAQLACTARRLPAADALPIVGNLLARDADAGDPRQPLLLWWAIEDKCAANRDAVLALLSGGAHSIWERPIVRQHILSRLMRRFASTGKREDLLVCARLFASSPGREQTAELTRGFEDAYKGRPLVGLPEELVTAMEKAGGESVLIGVRRGKPAAVEQALAMILNGSTDASKRLQLIQTFGETKQRKALPALLTLARETKQPAPCKAALGALQLYDSPEIASEVLKQFPTHSPETRGAALGLLTSRPPWALLLLRAVEAGTLDKTLVPADVVRRIKTMPGDGLSQLTTKLWPNIRQATSAELEKEIARLGELINLTSGSPYNGRKLFTERCAVCHKLFGAGAEVGPDLTVYPRNDLGNLLLNILNPSAEIREGYQSFNVNTKDGRSLTGFLADKDAQSLLLRTADGQTIPLAQSEIDSMQPAGISIMPEGLLATLSDQQVRDLFAYLRSTQPLNDGN
jgi:putative heme-binding domain-containing protein